ncbi:MAG: GNAT family N-acetyltransferase [Planctomycetota bacterium]|jgi:GNAT superfamily N-acetyltransferase
MESARDHQGLTIRDMRPGEGPAVAALVATVFDETTAPLYAPEGRAAFREWIDPEAMIARRGDHEVLVAQRCGSGPLVGVVEIRRSEHVSLLFVDLAHQRRGVGRSLLAAAVSRCRASRPDLEGVTVNAAPNSLEAYRRYGFRPTGPPRVVDGIAFTPMVLPLGSPVDRGGATGARP